MVSTQKKSQKRKRNDWFNLWIGIGFIFVFNYLGSLLFTRLDLTEDKRYSLSDATINQLEQLEEVAFVRVYLEGDLPARYKKLRMSIQESLDEFRVYSGENIQYEFIDPSESGDPEIQESIYRELSQKGLKYTSIRENRSDMRSEQIIFPGAIIQLGETEVAIQLLKSQIGAPEEVNINNSIQQIEYELSSGLNKALQKTRKVIGFTTGHGEFEPLDVADFRNTLMEHYTVGDVIITEELNQIEQIDSLRLVDVLIVANPNEAFSEKEKYVLDQYVMNGGKILWFLEGSDVSIDSLRKNNITMGIPLDLNLDDMLFRYGARVNHNLVMDLQALPLPVVTGMVGDQPKQEMFPWYYAPLVTNHPETPISNGLDAISTSYLSSVDSVGSKGIKKTVLLESSKYSKIAQTPHRVALNMLRQLPDERQYNKGRKTLSLLLEGNFESNFKNRLPQVENNPKLKFKERIESSKMIVVADADIIKNQVNRNTQEYYDMGYYPYTREVYANKEFAMNCLHYLADDSGIMLTRTKNFTLRLLDTQKATKQGDRYKILNIVLPILIISLLGLFFTQLRKKKYSK